MRLRINAVRQRIKLPDTDCGVNQVRDLENCFQDYQIMVNPFDSSKASLLEALFEAVFEEV